MEVTFTYNHEEYHGLKTLEGRKASDKNEQDHKEYYGEKREDSPSSERVQTEKKYERTKARKQFDEIDEIIKKGDY